MRYDIFGKMLPKKKKQTLETRKVSNTVLICLGAIGLMLVIAMVTFLVAIKPVDEVLVPNALTDSEGNPLDLLTAINKLQEKGLNVNISLKYSSEYKRGTVMSQRPGAGTVFKPGRHVHLTVSQGPVVNSVGNYVGKTLDSVKMELQELFSFDSEATIQLKEPVYMIDQAPAGTVLFQDPKPGTVIHEGEIIYVELIISKGLEIKQIQVGNYIGKGFLQTMKELSEKDLAFTFILAEADSSSAAGLIIEQKPNPGEFMPDKGVIELTMTKPVNIPKDSQFGFYQVELPKYPIFVDMELREKGKDGETSIIVFKNPGGNIGIPYVIKKDSEVVFYVNNKEYEED
jgi:beta-lactam-binding protein with PASTA domain